MFQKDQEILRDIENDEQKVIEARLLVEAGTREVQKCDEASKTLQEQKEALWERLAKRKADIEVERDRRIQRGEEESRDDITMDTTDLDYSIVAEQGLLPAALQAVEEQAYCCN